MNTKEWTTTSRDGSTEPETWHLYVDGYNVYGYASKYPSSSTYNWQAVRGDFRLSGTEPTVEEAMATAEEILAIPIEEFNARVADELLEDFLKIEKKLLSLRPDAKLMPGYHIGYETGVADTKGIIEQALSKVGAGGTAGVQT